jgi:hypothetical protein
VSTHKALVLFIVLCLQLQTAAAFLMPCAHQSAPVHGALPMSCHQMKTPEAPSQGKDETACVKCALACLNGGFQGPATPRATTSIAPAASVVQPFQAKHFYHFVPNEPQRPPIV